MTTIHVTAHGTGFLKIERDSREISDAQKILMKAEESIVVLFCLGCEIWEQDSAAQQLYSFTHMVG